jgi:XTP/dITP diphosphohydrolase
VTTGGADRGGPRLVIASNNPGKVAEFRRLLAGGAWTVVTLEEAGFAGELDEPGPTYADNALAKAAAVSSSLGATALADDSGIEVDALHGWPGPRSARWLGDRATDEDRLTGLLATVAARTPDDRRARYVCVVAVARPLADPVTAHGECLGEIVEPRGLGGFGYDPVFLSRDLGYTFGEAGDEEKDRVSHRARALRRLLESGVLDGGFAGL